MKSKSVFLGVLIALLIFSTATMCLAQSDTARLQGTVTDPQGGAVSEATVTVTSIGTGRVSTTTTNDLGYYSVSALSAGNYKVEVTQKGFKKVTRQLELHVAQEGVANFQLEVGQQTETVVVEAGSPVIMCRDRLIS